MIRRILRPGLLSAWAFSLLAILALASISGPLQPESFARWDSGHYLSIARDGYRIRSCDGQICGNAAWLPGYPLLIRMLRPVFPSQEWCGFFISNVCHLLALLLLVQDRKEKAWLVVLFPGSIYFHAIFPQSVFLLSFVLLIHYLKNEEFFYASIALGAAVSLYTSGLALLFLSNIVLIFKLHSHRVITQWIRELSRLNLLPVLIFAALLVLFQKETGNAFTFFGQQESYGRSPENPLSILYWIVEMATTTPYPSVRTAALQSLLVVFCLLLAGSRFFLRPSGFRRGDGLILFLCSGLYLLALTTGKNISLYRQEALLVPLALLLPERRFLVFAFAILFLLMSHFFFRSLLV
ncbi:MAG: hypothetical protein HS115_06790 [Spirochaetales bacterium]|nr:hypothetical protein [Spirochaetales bacterium]